MTLIGHDSAWREWRDAIAGGRMHHAWLLAGKRGLGKMTFAEAAARELLAEPGIPQPTGLHPDILVLTHEPKDDKEQTKRDEGKPFELKRNITVDQIRRMQQRLTTRPTMGSRRVIILDPADDLEKGAANALLKSLEEPPAGTYFLLVCHRPARLLATIRSRCRRLRFPELGDAELVRLVAQHAPDTDADTRAAAVFAAAGSPGAALEFVEQGLGPVYGLMRRIVREGDPHFVLRGELSAEIGGRPDRDRVQATFDLARAVVAAQRETVPRGAIPKLADVHAQLVSLAGQAPTANFDPGLLVAEIGTLLASVAQPS